MRFSLRVSSAACACAMTALTFQPALAAQNAADGPTLEAMEKCRERVIDGLSLGEKIRMKSAMNAIQGNPEFLAANKAVTDATTTEARMRARRNLAKVKLDLIARKDPSLQPVVARIRAAQSALLK